MKKLVLVLVLIAAVATMGFNLVSAQEVDRTGWPETFIIGVYPGDNVAEALAAVEPMRVYLEETLGVRTVLITGTSYNAVIEAMAANRADAMEVGPFSYVLAADVADAEAIAVANYATEVNPAEVPGYYSLMFTKKGSGYRPALPISRVAAHLPIPLPPVVISFRQRTSSWIRNSLTPRRLKNLPMFRSLATTQLPFCRFGMTALKPPRPLMVTWLCRSKKQGFPCAVWIKVLMAPRLPKNSPIWTR